MITIEHRKNRAQSYNQIGITDEPTVGQLVRKDDGGNSIPTVCVGCINSVTNDSFYAITMDKSGVANIVHRLVREAVLMDLANFELIRAAATEAARDAVRALTPSERLKEVK